MSEVTAEKEVFDEICKEVARRHGLLLSPDDPVLVTVTLNQLAMKRAQEQSSAAFETLKDGLEEIYLRQAQETKDTANKLVGAALRTAERSIGDMAAQVASEVAKRTEASLAAAEQRMAATAGSIKFDRNVSVFCCILALCFSCLAIYSMVSP
ncbi:hypothetical protein [Microbulbifer aggregans]|uniref:hypothetical protein n=1 Tax=Microbulbifer aggregans TaxID=1769779 RepID=UPI001CFE2E16|nr:hypothetical protein [Microbulbifer aggregans]